DNPYVTIDHMDRNTIHIYGNSNPTPYGSRGKEQPYASYVKMPTLASPGIPPPALGYSPVIEQITRAVDPLTQHTFGGRNDKLPLNGGPLIQGHYEWLVHLDRQLISPMD